MTNMQKASLLDQAQERLDRARGFRASILGHKLGSVLEPTHKTPQQREAFHAGFEEGETAKACV